MMFRKLFKKRRSDGSADEIGGTFEGQAPKTSQPVAVIGDVHGRIDCLEKMLRQLESDAPTAKWVFVGDYIDRGDHSAEVLTCLRDLQHHRANSVFLRGNHEEMMLNFLEDPQNAGNRWMRYGGLQTMASFGISGLRPSNDPETLLRARDTLLDRMENGLRDWLAGLPRIWSNGNVAITHAGADPQRPINEQSKQALTWGHPDFGRTPRNDGIWVVHGHTIVAQPKEQSGVISVDTGAYATGKLSAAILENEQVRFSMIAMDQS